MRQQAPRSDAGAVGRAAGDADLVPGRAAPAWSPVQWSETRNGERTADGADREAVLHVYGVETVYAAVVDGSAHMADPDGGASRQSVRAVSVHRGRERLDRTSTSPRS